MNRFTTLFWKECRSNLHLVILQAAVLILPVLLVFSVAFGERSDAPFSDLVAASLVFGSTFGVILSQLTLLCLGGLLIGSERKGRTFEFLFNQPVTRFSIASSKLLFGTLMLASVWVVGGLMMLAGYQLAGEGNLNGGLGVAWFSEIAAVGMLLFSSSWLASNRFDHPVLAIALGALITTIIVMMITILLSRFEPMLEFDEHDWTRTLVVTITSLALIGLGTAMFTSRKSP